ncbi:MAG: BamA/TamA family outer membrane protein [Cyanobacteriota bacterium]
MTTKKTLLIGLLALFLLANNNIASFSQAEEEEEFVSTPAHEIEPDALKSSSRRTYDEGITIKEIEISGNMLVPKEKIIDNMQTKPGSIFDRNSLQVDLKKIYEMGYFTDKIKAVPEASPTGVKLRIEVEENIPVTGFNITGNTAISTSELEELFKDQTGLPQNIAQLNDAISKIEKNYSDKGFVLARVKKITDDPDGMVNIEINEGKIDKIKFVGNTKTKDYIIKRNMYTSEGTIYNEKVLKQDLKRIFGTQAFEDVRRVVTASPDDPDKYNLTVEVDEKRTGSISLGGGVDTGSGIFGSLGYTNPNFLGRGQVVSAVVLAGSGVIRSDTDTVRKATIQFEGNWTEPRVANTLNSLQVNAFGRDFASFQVPLAIERRIGGEIEWARPIKRFKNVAGSMSLGIEKIGLREGDYYGSLLYYTLAGVDISERAEQLEGGTFLSVGPSLAYDTRDDRLNPTRGWYNTIKLKQSFGMGGDISQFGRVHGSIRKYIPIMEDTTLAFNVQGGSKLFGELPEFSAFRMGGSYTVRGFREGNLGHGGQYVLGSAELRGPIPILSQIKKIPFVKNVRGALFFDAGKLYNQAISNRIFDRPGYGLAAGAGLRLNIPGLGPIRIDYGFPLTKVGKYGEKKGRFNFGFGEKF